MLDLYGRVLRRGSLHGDEHDEQRAASSACEVDVPGVIGMHALRLASETPSALLDWNNNYGDDPNKAVCFHCSNLPKHFFQEVKMDYQEIIAGTVGKLNTFGTCVGRVKPGDMSFARFSTDDSRGQSARLCRHGPIHLRSARDIRRRGCGGNSGAAGTPPLHLRERIRTSRSGQLQRDVAAAVYEAAGKYLGWEMYWHHV